MPRQKKDPTPGEPTNSVKLNIISQRMADMHGEIHMTQALVLGLCKRYGLDTDAIVKTWMDAKDKMLRRLELEDGLSGLEKVPTITLPDGSKH